MTDSRPTIKTVDGRRIFACVPAAVVVFLVNSEERLLLLSHPKRESWELVSGALEHGETIWDAARRELAEETGPALQAQSLGTLHVNTFQYDPNASHMLSLSVLMACQGDEVIPGDDMAGAKYHWFSLDELADPNLNLLLPARRPLLRHRAIELYRQWKDDPPTWDQLQPPLDTNRIVQRR